MRLQKQLIAALTAALDGRRTTQRVPEGGALVWSWFLDLSATRTYHAAGAHPISYGEIEAYARLMRWPIEPRHVELIRALDAAWLDHAHKRRPGTAPLSSPNAPEVTEEAFDVMFS